MNLTLGLFRHSSLGMVVVCVAGLLFTGAVAADPGSAADVDAVLAGFSAALSSGDTVALRQLMAPDFALLEDGRVYDRDGAIASVTEVLATGALSRVSSHFHTRIRGDFAWSHYQVTGQFRGPGEALPLNLIEAAVLQRTKGRWRLLLVTTMPRGPAPDEPR